MGRTALVLVAWAGMAALPASWSGAARAVPLWRVAGEGRGAPATDGATVYFLSARHEVIAVSAATGAVQWRAGTGESGATTFGSTVRLSAGIVIAGDYNLIGLAAGNGVLRWRFDPSSGYGPGIYLGEVKDQVVYAGSASGHVYAVRVEDGRQVWATRAIDHERSTIFAPVVGGDEVVAGYSTFGAATGGGVVVIDRGSGRVRWRRAFPRGAVEGSTGFAGGPVASDGLVYASSAGGSVHAFDATSGASRWTAGPVARPDGREPGQDWRALARSGAMIIAGSASGVVTGLEIDSGRERWRYAHRSGGSVAFQISADEDCVYVPHVGGLLVAVDSHDGRERWETGGFSDGFQWAPVVNDGNVYAASRAGLFAFARRGR